MELQLITQILISMCLLCYYISALPMKKRFQNFLEIFNEMTYLSCLIMCYTFNDYVDNVRLRYEIGGFFIAIVLFNIFINLSIYVVILIRCCYKKSKKTIQELKLVNNL